MKLKTSEFLLSKKAELQRIVEILGKEFDYVSILGTDVTGKNYSVRTSGIGVRPSPDSERGFVVRVFQESGFSEYSFNHLDVDAVCDKVREIARSDRDAFLSTHPPVDYPKPPNDEKAEIFYVGEVPIPIEEQSPKVILEKMSAIHDKVKARYPQVVQLVLELSVTQVNKIFVSANKDLYQSYGYGIALGYAFASDEKSTQDAFLNKSGICGLELADQLEELAETASFRAVELLSAERLEPGEYDIICDPDFTGLIAHEAFGHGAEMDMYVKDRAKGKEYVDARVASDKVVMRDGAAAYDEVSSYLFDDEGNPGQDTIIIQNGILKHGMCDELSALLLGIEPTGNGKRESYKRRSYTRMTNTFFEEGEDSLDDMIASIEFGYLLEGFSSGMEDPKNWGIQCVASKGREIVDGKLTGKVVSPVYLTGYVPDLLESISMVSPGLVLSGSGYCGKGWKEWVKTSTGGSYIKARGKLS
ncbi:MAG: TldD/PmbA family protein [Peptostreptococcaceae bacterium]|nr:TldD/PmbA family protein [Peptostreptococcaceae bacterium]